MCRPSEVFLASTSYTICAKPTPKVRLRVMHGLLPCGTSDAGDSHIDLEIDKHSCASNVEPSTISHLVDWRVHAPTAHSTQAGEMTGQHSYLGRGGKRSQAGMQGALAGEKADPKMIGAGIEYIDGEARCRKLTCFFPLLSSFPCGHYPYTKLPFLCILDDTAFAQLRASSLWFSLVTTTNWFTLISPRTCLPSSNMVDPWALEVVLRLTPRRTPVSTVFERI
ncbi:hypothetical protein L210DRAFT_2249150 [Boletus edulis BED1]|uniref:Uncharacterized protein n=1 Tax=Boletus edulis BED1 TaxID=1328754 RepID=A0AAD4BDT5_BOLED|nr:hypothetical protein L210DRAFT_2249150 [Boletus edulis BED1]